MASALPPARKAVPVSTSRREQNFYSSSHVAIVGDCRTGERGAALHRARAPIPLPQ